jgi:hypothetical protein
MHSGDGEVIVIYIVMYIVIYSSVNLEERQTFGSCVFLEVECDVETAGSKQDFSGGIS